MNDTVKLIIEIPKDYYEIIKHNVEHHLTDYRPFEIIGNGIPLDDDLESLRAEVRAYFNGQAYGWEEGRKALIEDAKAEIDKAQEPYKTSTAYDEGVRFGLMLAYQTIDKYKAESEGKAE